MEYFGTKHVGAFNFLTQLYSCMLVARPTFRFKFLLNRTST